MTKETRKIYGEEISAKWTEECVPFLYINLKVYACVCACLCLSEYVQRVFLEEM